MAQQCNQNNGSQTMTLEPGQTETQTEREITQTGNIASFGNRTIQAATGASAPDPTQHATVHIPVAHNQQSASSSSMPMFVDLSRPAQSIYDIEARQRVQNSHNPQHFDISSNPPAPSHTAPNPYPSTPPQTQGSPLIFGPAATQPVPSANTQHRRDARGRRGGETGDSGRNESGRSSGSSDPLQTDDPWKRIFKPAHAAWTQARTEQQHHNHDVPNPWSNYQSPQTTRSNEPILPDDPQQRMSQQTMQANRFIDWDAWDERVRERERIEHEKREMERERNEHTQSYTGLQNSANHQHSNNICKTQIRSTVLHMILKCRILKCPIFLVRTFLHRHIQHSISLMRIQLNKLGSRILRPSIRLRRFRSLLLVAMHHCFQIICVTARLI